eukprot:UN34348
MLLKEESSPSVVSDSSFRKEKYRIKKSPFSPFGLLNIRLQAELPELLVSLRTDDSDDTKCPYFQVSVTEIISKHLYTHDSWSGDGNVADLKLQFFKGEKAYTILKFNSCNPVLTAAWRNDLFLQLTIRTDQRLI